MCSRNYRKFVVCPEDYRLPGRPVAVPLHDKPKTPPTSSRPAAWAVVGRQTTRAIPCTPYLKESILRPLCYRSCVAERWRAAVRAGIRISTSRCGDPKHWNTRYQNYLYSTLQKKRSALRGAVAAHLRVGGATHDSVFAGEVVLRLPLASLGDVTDQVQPLLTRATNSTDRPTVRSTSRIIISNRRRNGDGVHRV